MSATSGGGSVGGIRVGGGSSGSVNESSEAGESSHSTMSITDSPSTSFQTNHETNVTKINLEDESVVPGSVQVDMTGSNVNLTVNERHSAEGMVNMGFEQDEGANRGEVEFKSINGELKSDKVSEAVNLELVNMVPYSNGNSANFGVPVNGIPVKKDCEGGDLSSPYDEYFVPVNEHKKYMRGEKLYVTKDKRRPTSWRKCLSWIVACAVVSAILIVAILAGTGVILSQDSNEIKKVSVGRNLGDSNTKPLVTEGSSDSQEESAVGKWISNIENMTHAYVPRSVEFILPVDNIGWSSAYLNNNSAEYHGLIDTTKNYLKKVLLHKDIFDLDRAKPEFNMINISQDPFQVLYRMRWNSEEEANNPVDQVIIQNIKNKLIENLNKNGSYIEKYHIDMDRIYVGGVANLCLKSNGGCSHICYYNYQNQQFSCSCPANMKLDSTLHICIDETESSEKDYASIPSIHYPENNFEPSEVGNNENYSYDHSDHDHSTHDHSDHDHSTHDHSDHDHSTHDHSDHEHSTHDHSDHDHSTHDHSDHEHSTHDHSDHDHSMHDHSDYDHSTHDHSDHEHSTHDHSDHDHSTYDNSDGDISTLDHNDNDHSTLHHIDDSMHNDNDHSTEDHNNDSTHDHSDHSTQDHKNHDHFTRDQSDYDHSTHDRNDHSTQYHNKDSTQAHDDHYSPDDHKNNLSHDPNHKSNHEHDFGHYTFQKNTGTESPSNFDADHEVNHKFSHESSPKLFSETASDFNLKNQSNEDSSYDIVMNSTPSSEVELEQNEKFSTEMDKKLTTSTESPSFNREHPNIDVTPDLQEHHEFYDNNFEHPTTVKVESKDHHDHFNDQMLISMSSESSHDSSLETTSSTQSYFTVNLESSSDSKTFLPSTAPTPNADFSNISHHHISDSGNDKILHSVIQSNIENAKNVSISNNLGQSDSEHTIPNSNKEKPDIYESTEHHHHVPLLEEILIKDSSLNSTENQEISKYNVPGQTFLNNVEINAKGEPVVEEIVIDKSSPQGTEPSVMSSDYTPTSNYEGKHKNEIESKNKSLKEKDSLQGSIVDSRSQSDEKMKTMLMDNASESTTKESTDLNNNNSNLGDVNVKLHNQSNIASFTEDTFNEFNNQNKNRGETANEETATYSSSNTPAIEKTNQKTENEFVTQSNWLPEESTTTLNSDLKSDTKNYSNPVSTASHEEISTNDTKMHPELKTSVQMDLAKELEQKANAEEESTSTLTFNSPGLNLNDTNSSKLMDGFSEINKSKSLSENEPTESAVDISKYNESNLPEWNLASSEGDNETKPLLTGHEMTNKSSSKTEDEITESESPNLNNDQTSVQEMENKPMSTEIPNNYETTVMAVKKFEKPEDNLSLISHPSKMEASEEEHENAKEGESGVSSSQQTKPNEPFASEVDTTTTSSFQKEESTNDKAEKLNNQQNINVKPTEPFLVSQGPHDHYTQPIQLENTNTDDLSNNIKDELIDNDEFNTLLDKNYKNDYLNDSKEVFNKYSNKQIFLKGDKKKLKEFGKLDKAESDKKTTKSYVVDKDHASQKHTTENSLSSNYGIHVEEVTPGVTEATKNDGGLSVNIPVPSYDSFNVDNPEYGTLHTISPGLEVDKQTSDLDGENNKEDIFDSKEDFKSEKDFTKLDKDHKYDKQKSGKKKDLKKKGSSKDGKNVELDESKKYHFETAGEKNETLRPNYSLEQENSKENLGVTLLPIEDKVTSNQVSSESDLKLTTTSHYESESTSDLFSQSHNVTFVPVLEGVNVTQHSQTTDASIEKVTQGFETLDHEEKLHRIDGGQVEGVTVGVETSTDVTIAETDNASRENVDNLKQTENETSVVGNVKSSEKGVDAGIEPHLEKENSHVKIEGSSSEETFSSATQGENVRKGANDQISHSMELARPNLNNETVPLKVSEVLLKNNVSATSSEITNDSRQFETITVGEGATSKEHFAFEVFNTTHENQTESKNFGLELTEPHPVTVLDGITFEAFDRTKNASIDQKLMGESDQHSSFSVKPVSDVTVPTAQSTFTSSVNNGDSSIFSVKSAFLEPGHQGGHEVRLQNSSAFAIRDGKIPIRRVLNYSTPFQGPYTVHNFGSSTSNNTRMNQFGDQKDLFYDEVGGTTIVSQAPNFAFANNFNNVNVTHFNVENESGSGASFNGHFTPQGVYHHSLTNSSPSFTYSNTQPSFTIKGESGDFGRSIVYILGNNTKSGVNSSVPTRTHHVIFKNSTVFALGNVSESYLSGYQPVGVEKTLMDSENSTANNLFHSGRNSSVINVINKFGDHIGFISKCAAGQFQCINGTSRRGSACIDLSSKCDSINDCTDGSDEIGCVENNCQGNFQCSDGTCLKRHLVCNGIVECTDGSDEKQCENRKCEFDEFKCPSGRCIPLLWQCDGKADCVNHTDEQNCQRSCGNDEYLCPEGWCVPLTYRCNGIKDCSNGEDEQLCDCSLDEFKCQSGGCVHKNQVCNGIDDCPDRSDEWSCMRLQQDSMLLEIRTPAGEYEPVCSDMWSSSLSDQVCASLGYASSTAMVEDTDSVPFFSDKPFYVLKNSTHFKENSTHLKENNILNNLVRESNNTCLSKKWVKIMCQEFSCGSRSMTDSSAFEGRLVGGVSANAGQWPSVALLYNVRNMQSCTANVLTPKWVLASYNCLKSGNKNFNLRDWKFFGGSTVFDLKKENGETRNITAVVTHPQMKFNQFLFSNDLALVKLDKSLSFSSTLGAVCLPNQPIHSRLICVTAGWGKNGVEDESLRQQLQYLPVPTMNLTDCNSTEHYSGFITDDEICAGYSTVEKSLCYNDEGAPLMCINKRGEWELQGTLTYHDNCGRGSHPSIFNSIKTANEWIKKTIGSSVDKSTYISQR